MKKIKIDNIEYNIDIEKAKKLGVLTPSRMVGQYYRRENDVYIVAVIGTNNDGDAMICFISILKGTRYTDPVPVKDCHNITVKEWSGLTFSNEESFKQVDMNVNLNILS